MAEKLLVLDEPFVDAVPIERRVAGEKGGLLERLLVGPDRVLFDSVAHADGPVARLALVGTARPSVAWLEEVVPQVVLGDVVNGQVARLV